MTTLLASTSHPENESPVLVGGSNEPSRTSSPEAALEDRVQDALQQSPYLSSRHLRFEAAQGRVVLKGVVASYYQKQMAQEALRRLEGVRHIENRLEVAWV